MSTDPRAFSRRQQEAADRKAARDSANADTWNFVALSQIAEALFSLRDEVQDMRIAMETQRK